MGPMPDLTWIFHFAIFGIICAVLIGLVGGGWLLYHLIVAASMYMGAA